MSALVNLLLCISCICLAYCMIVLIGRVRRLERWKQTVTDLCIASLDASGGAEGGCNV